MTKYRSLDLFYKLAFFVLVGAALALVAFSARTLRTVHHSVKGVATADIKVLGTSNLHSWTMEDKEVSCSARFTYAADKAIPAGVTRAVVLLAACGVKADGVVSCTGTNTLKMSDYQIRPPTYMLGMLRTSNKLTIAFAMQVMK
jgi:hypothetical protein